MDKYGLSWQIVPTVLREMLKDHESPKGQRAMEALLRMKKHEEDRHPRARARGCRRAGHGLN
jgi:predicted 3-demethylubiquinone-9 3-methyltransferase (glyoxalase superfamily)